MEELGVLGKLFLYGHPELITVCGCFFPCLVGTVNCKEEEKRQAIFF